MGAPYIDGAALIREVGPLPGVALEPVRFTPTASIHEGVECGGVQITITDRAALRSVDVGVAIASAIARFYPTQFPVNKMQRLLRHKPTLEAIRAGKSLDEIRALWDIATFEETAEEVPDVLIRARPSIAIALASYGRRWSRAPTPSYVTFPKQRWTRGRGALLVCVLSLRAPRRPTRSHP